MKEGWVYMKLGEVCEIERGGSPRPIKDFITTAPDGLNWIKIGDTDPQGKYIYSTKEKIKPTGLKKTRWVEVDDFLLSNSMSFGRPYILKTNGCIHDGWLVLRKYQQYLNADFFYYLLLSSRVQKQFQQKAQGSTVSNLNTQRVSGVEIAFPPLPEQQRIVSYLDAEFAKIEALKANAEKQLQAAKDLFQAALKELLTPKEGWVEKKLGELCSICGEYGLNESATDYNGVRYLRITDITDDGELNNDKVSAQNKGKKNQEELEVGDILFARTGATVGKTLVYRKEFGKCVFAGYLIRYRTNPNIILPQYLFYYTHSTKYYDWVRNNQAAAAQPNISAQKYNCLIISFPTETSEQQRIADRLDALSANVKALQTNYTETITLCNDLKQALLKKVFG